MNEEKKILGGAPKGELLLGESVRVPSPSKRERKEMACKDAPAIWIQFSSVLGFLVFVLPTEQLFLLTVIKWAQSCLFFLLQKWELFSRFVSRGQRGVLPRWFCDRAAIAMSFPVPDAEVSPCWVFRPFLTSHASSPRCHVLVLLADSLTSCWWVVSPCY